MICIVIIIVAVMSTEMHDYISQARARKTSEVREERKVREVRLG